MMIFNHISWKMPASLIRVLFREPEPVALNEFNTRVCGRNIACTGILLVSLQIYLAAHPEGLHESRVLPLALMGHSSDF